MSDAPTTRIDVRRRRPRPSTGAIGVGVGVGLAAALLTFPDRLGLDAGTPFVQLVAFRPQIAVGLLVVAALVLAGGRRARPAALALALVAVLGLAVVLPRASADTAASGPGDLSVLTVNTFHGRADADGLAGLVRARDPDVVALPEAGGDLRRRLSAALDDDQGGAGYRSYVADAESDESPMTVFVKRSLGRPEVAADRETEFPSLVIDLDDVDGQPVRVVATHPQSPKPGDTFAWRRDVAALARWCDDGRPTVVAGDLNATLDHSELRAATAGCTDAASAVGDGLVGTWPANLPRVLGVQIDHVLLAGGPRAVGVDTIDIAGTDHRGVLARVALG